MTTIVGIVESEWKFVGDNPQSRVNKSPLQLYVFFEVIVWPSTRETLMKRPVIDLNGSTCRFIRNFQTGSFQAIQINMSKTYEYKYH